MSRIESVLGMTAPGPGGRGRHPMRTDPLLRTLPLVLFVSLLSLAPPGRAAESPVDYPVVAGTTVIHAEGVTGITLWLPEEARLFADDLKIEVGEGTKSSWTGFRVDSEPRPWCDFCFTNFTSFYPEHEQQPDYATCTGDDFSEVGCRYDPGPLELYIASDGSVTLTVRFRNLSGSTELTATAGVDGTVKPLPVRECDPMPDCDSGFSYGGETHEIGLDGRPAVGWVVGFSRDRRGPGDFSVNPGVGDFKVCAYPSSLFAGSDSGDPADHPRGCDEEALPAPQVTTGGAGKNDVNWRAHGKQYLGFSVWNRALFGDALVGFWGMWLEAGMECPSKDFSACTQPV